MSFTSLSAGALAGAFTYGIIQLRLYEREAAVRFSAIQIAEAVRGDSKKSGTADYNSFLSRQEHIYYEKIRCMWNRKVLSFRTGVLDLFKSDD
uniref:AlNc14C11G1341 protein n=1 Tax=Albugo laibachii Nc14 TaxID=890382 RepID=F0W2W3_9STRA|nr:AlNc14C11G1341 [Albugo laibachii Nc14]|eukprot:CCA15399.1 AlNc14C11G1341 [Albugo laibachii Nc14]